MEIDYKKYQNLCTQEEPVFCTNQCPLGVDVRGLMSKVRSGNCTAAYKSYRSHVLFPEIVSRICDEPCRNACVRKNIDQTVSVRMIEKACCEHTADKEDTSFYFPPKNKRVAVIGGGLGGLSCAIKAARKGYNVHLYEARGKLGGTMWDHRNVVPGYVIEEEFDRIVKNDDIKIHLNTKVNSLQDIEFDALYIATGRLEENFGLIEGFQPESLSTAQNGIFMSGKTAGREERSVLIPIREGIRVAQSIDSYLKVGTMGGEAGRHEVIPSKLHVDISQVIAVGGIKPEDPNGYTVKEAVEEAKRCLQCACNTCKNHCELIDYYKKKPKKIVEDVLGTLNVVTSITTRVASRQLNSCNLCGLCKTVCPVNLDFEEIFLASRRELHKGGNLPPAFHDFWMQDMNFSNSSQAFLAINSPNTDKSQYMFFPGCQMGASDPEYVTKSYHYLLKVFDSNVSLMVGCCGVPAEWAGREDEFLTVRTKIKKHWKDFGKPTLILACPTCKKIFEKYLPKIKILSLWNIIGEKGIAEINETYHMNANKKVTVFDSCASRHDPEVRTSVRTILKKLGYQLKELPNSGEFAKCCGYGGQIHAVNFPLLEQIVENRVNASPFDYVTYCTNCRDTFSSAQKPAVHILDLLFCENIAARALRKPPTLTQRRENRIILKKKLLNKFGGMAMKPTDDCPKIEVYISPEVYKKMDRNLILAEDAIRTISYCESTGNKILDTVTGNFIGHLQNGVITYWVVYRAEGDGLRLESIYSHRLRLEKETE